MVNFSNSNLTLPELQYKLKKLKELKNMETDKILKIELNCSITNLTQFINEKKQTD